MNGWEPIVSLIVSIVGTVSGAVGVYAAIRSDLAAMKATVEILSKSLDRAHVRIDELHK